MKGNNELTEVPTNQESKGEVFELTKEQIVFYRRQSRRRQLLQQKKEGVYFGIAEEDELERVQTALLKSIIKFGMKEAQKIFERYRMDSEAYFDIQQALSLKFFEVLDKYDPLKTTPTTYFRPHFREVISTYLSENTVHLSQYDIKNARVVKRAINYYEQHGIFWTEDMIANRTGLSPKVVHSTIQYHHNAQYASLDDENAATLTSRIMGPEEHYLEQSKQQVISQEIKHALTEMEQKIFFMRLNLDGIKEKSFDDIHLETGLSIKEIKSIFNSAALKLGDNLKLCATLNIRKNQTYAIQNVELHDNASDILQNQIQEQLEQ